MVIAGLAMLLLALAAVGMVLATAGLDGDGEANRVPGAEEDRHGYPGRPTVSSRLRPHRELILH